MNKFKYGKKFNVRNGLMIMIDKNGKLDIGDNVFFNRHCTIGVVEKIEIDDGTIFGEMVKIYDHNHRFRNSKILIKNQGYTSSAIKIGKQCWIGSGVIILKGANIGNNCVIGAGCIIDYAVPDNTIVTQTKDVHDLKKIKPED